MKEIIAKLVSTNCTQRYYELSGSEHLLRTDGCHIVCVSDAYTHIERLVFIGEKYPSGYGNTGVQIDGSHTMRMYGGDKRYVYPDEVYLRHLGMVNGVRIVLDGRGTK